MTDSAALLFRITSMDGRRRPTFIYYKHISYPAFELVFVNDTLSRLSRL